MTFLDVKSKVNMIYTITEGVNVRLKEGEFFCSIISYRRQTRILTKPRQSYFKEFT